MILYTHTHTYECMWCVCVCGKSTKQCKHTIYCWCDDLLLAAVALAVTTPCNVLYSVVRVVRMRERFMCMKPVPKMDWTEKNTAQTLNAHTYAIVDSFSSRFGAWFLWLATCASHIHLYYILLLYYFSWYEMMNTHVFHTLNTHFNNINKLAHTHTHKMCALLLLPSFQNKLFNTLTDTYIYISIYARFNLLTATPQPKRKPIWKQIAMIFCRSESIVVHSFESFIYMNDDNNSSTIFMIVVTLATSYSPNK